MLRVRDVIPGRWVLRVRDVAPGRWVLRVHDLTPGSWVLRFLLFYISDRALIKCVMTIDKTILKNIGVGAAGVGVDPQYMFGGFMFKRNKRHGLGAMHLKELS